MKIMNKDIWTFKPSEVDAICITTNGFVKKNGSAVMGRGCALQCKNIYKGIEFTLGDLIKKNGNCVNTIIDKKIDSYAILSFPTKPINNSYDGSNCIDKMKSIFKIGDKVPGWACKSDIKIILRSLLQLKEIVYNNGWNKIVLPCPGIGFGELSPNDVIPLLNEYLDDRYIVTILENK